MFKYRTLISATDRAIGVSSTIEARTGDSSELPPSAHLVLSTDDLLSEILFRLPVISLLLFKSVSKRWLSLITDPNFTSRRSKISNLDPPSGMFLSRQQDWIFDYDFVPFDIRIPAYRYPNQNTFSFHSKQRNILFLNSCNGLILLCMSADALHVYNPSMNLLKKLPKFHKEVPIEDDIAITLCGNIMAFDPTKSPHYKVVTVGSMLANGIESLKILIYSSETCKWSDCDVDQFSVDSFTGGFQQGIYLNDSINWLKKVNGSCLLFKFNVSRLVLTSIQTPGILEGKVCSDHKLFSSCNCLVLVCIVSTSSPHSQHMNIYEMNSAYSGWLVKYTINLDDITRMYPKTRRLSPKTKRFCSSVRCIVLGEKEEDTFIVIERNGLVLQYKIALKTIHLLHDLGSKVTTDNTQNFQFIASFAGV